MPLSILSAGSNAQGQLGHSLNEDSHIFRSCIFEGCAIGALPEGTRKVITVAAGANHTIVLLEVSSPASSSSSSTNAGDHPGTTTTTELWGCGDGRAGQLGPRYKRDRLAAANRSSDVFRRIELPLEEKGLEGYKCKMVAAGWEATYLVFSPPNPPPATDRRSDIILSMGTGDWGDLGVGNNSITPEQGKMTRSMLEHAPSKVYTVDLNHVLVDETRTLSSQGSVVVQSIAAHQHHIVVHLRDHKNEHGCIVGWGAARHGQISSLPTTPGGSAATKPPSVIDQPRRFLTEDMTDPFVSCGVGSQHSAFLKASGKIIAIGSNRKGQLDLPMSGAKGVDCTWNGTFVIVNEEEGSGDGVQSAGSNTHGQLGCGSAGSVEGGDRVVSFPDSLRGWKLLKIACGSEHVLTLWSFLEGVRPTEVWAWGWNDHGNLGLGGTNDVHSPKRIYRSSGDAGDVVDVWAGLGTSWICVGRNDNGI